MTIQSPYLPGANVAFLDARGFISRPWYLFLQNQFNLTDPNTNIGVNDLAVQVAFDNDNTSQVADLQAQIDKLDLSGNPFEIASNATADTAMRRLDGVDVMLDFVPSSPQLMVDLSVPLAFMPSSPVVPAEVYDMPVMLSGSVSQSNIGTLLAYSARHG